jgi:tRNA pseudouridine13 synthase
MAFVEALPYLTADMPGIGGSIKDATHDFAVDELPLYPASGQGDHVYFKIRKAGLPTPAALERIARFMGVRASDIGVAGLKDSQALTTQWMSLEHADFNKLSSYKDSQIKIIEMTRHNNKLRPGHLAGNRFDIRIRGVSSREVARAQAILDVLLARGVPNFFGEQRFGARGDTGDLGAALIRNDLDEFVKIFLGRSRPTDPPDCKAARDAFDAGFYQRAAERWPWHFADQRRALAAYKKKQRAVQAVLAVDKRMRRLFVSAFQSEIFNKVLAARLATIDRVMKGDLAQKRDSGGVFLVEDEAVEGPRAKAFEISPTGPIVGVRGLLAQGEPGKIELDALAAYKAKVEDFDHVGTLKVNGGRRALRFAIEQPRLSAGKDDRGDFVRLSFVAPPGCYATVVLSEITKTQALLPQRAQKAQSDEVVGEENDE